MTSAASNSPEGALRGRDLRLVVLLTLLTAITPLSIDMVLPALPGIAAYFGVPSADGQLLVTVFVLGFAIAHLGLGPLADRYGRRPVLLAGLALYLAGGLGCLVAGDVATLLACRFLQGVGACAGPVIARAIVSDVFDGARATQAFSIVTAGMGLAPILAPAIGGVILLVTDWRGIFAALTATGLVLLIMVWTGLSETRDRRTSPPLRVGSMAAAYAAILVDRTFVAFVLPSALSGAALFSFLTNAPFVLIETHGLGTQMFALAFAVVMFGYVAGATFAARLARRLDRADLVMLGAGVQAVAATTLVTAVIIGKLGPLAVVLPMTGVMAGIGILRPGSTAGAMAPFPHRAGAASALIGFLQMSAGAAAGTALALATGGGEGPMAFAILGYSLASLAAFRLLRPKVIPPSVGSAGS